MHGQLGTLGNYNADTAPLTRDQFLDAPLLQLVGCSLGMVCHDGCTRPGQLDVKLAAGKYGRRLQLRRVIARLRCTGCRRPPAQVAISYMPPDAAGWRVVLVP